MKKVIFLLLFFFNFPLMAQSITIEITGGDCDDGSPYTLNFLDSFNSKNRYSTSLGGTNEIRMEWNNLDNRWELNFYDNGVNLETEFFNSANTSPNPPCFAFDGNWTTNTGVNCETSSLTDLTGDCETSATNSGGNVPTLSEWGLIILALLLMTFGTLQLIRRESGQTT